MIRFSKTRLLQSGAAVLGALVLFVLIALARHGLPYCVTRVAFNSYLWHERNEIKKQSATGESNIYYFTSYYLNGMLSAAEATGSRYILKKTLGHLDAMIATAITIQYKGETFHVWGPFNVTPRDIVEKPNVHFTLQAAVPLARAAAIIKHNPKFMRSYGNRVGPYTDFVKSAVFDLWYKIEYRNTVPWINVEYVPIWNDNATNMGLCALFMYDATGDTYYRDIATAVGEAFKAKLTPSGRGWIWESNTIPIGSDTDNTPGSVGNQAGVPDTSHANREAMFVAYLYEAGLVFSKEDVERMANTFVDNIWNQSIENPSFANYINGSNRPYRVYMEPGLNGSIYHGWAIVGGYSPEAQNILYHAMKAIVRGRKNPSLTRNKTGYGGMLALTGHMLRNYKVLKDLQK
jgi:hypothetical protein